jgi:hypothetical protein
MGLRAPNTSSHGNGNGSRTRTSLPGVSAMRKRSLSRDNIPLLIPNGNSRRLSHATLQKIFIIMMGVVFGIYVILTAYLIHGHNSVLETERSGNKQWGPSITNENDKNQILREHIQRIREEEEQQEDTKKQQQQPIISSTSSILSKVKDLLLEEVDIHEMKHPKEIKKGASGGVKTTSTTIQQSPSSPQILKAYLEPVYFDDWNIKPLPVRNTTKQQLQVIEYPRLNRCSKLPELWPIDDFPGDFDPFLPYVQHE